MATLVPSGFSTFTARTTPALAYPSVASNGTIMVAVSYSGDTSPVLTSTDGVTWTQRAAGLAAHLWNDVIWVEELGLFVAVSDASGETTNVMTSSNGTAWTARTADDNGWIAVAWNGTTLVAVSYNNGTANVMTSTDGITWATQVSSGITAGLDDIAWSSTLGLFVGVTSATIYTSTDGIAWTARTKPAEVTEANPFAKTVAWCGDVFIVPVTVTASGTGTGVARSTDGITWTYVAFAGAASLRRAIAYSAASDTIFLVQGDGSSHSGAYRTSDDSGLTWTSGTALDGDWYDAFWDDTLGVIAVVGISGNAEDVESATYRALPAVTGLSHLEGESVSVVADGIVIASPNNPAYDAIIVTSGEIALPEGEYTSVTVGLPFTSDVRTLDLESSGSSSAKQSGVNVKRLGLWTEEAGALWAGQRPPTTDAVGTAAGLRKLVLEDEDRQPLETGDLKTGYAEVPIDGKWSQSGSIFLRHVDPTPVTLLAAIPYFDQGR